MAIVTLKGVAGPLDRVDRVDRVGRADQASAPVLGAVTLEVDAGPPARIEGADRFEILVDGSPIRIDASGVPEAFLKLEERSKTGSWADVEADLLAGPFLDKAPGPHMPVKLQGTALLPGEVVHVLGEVTATEPAPDTGAMRTPPTYRPSEIRAIAVAAGPEAERFIELLRAEHAPAAARPAVPDKVTSWKTWAWGALFFAVVALLISATIASRAARVELWMLVLSAVSLVMRFKLSPPPFLGREAVPTLTWWDFYYLSAGLTFLASGVLFLGTAVGALGGPGEIEGSASVIVPLLAAVTSVLPLEAWSKTRQFARIARLILNAPVKATEDGAWSCVVGVVADPTPIQWAGAEAAIARAVEGDKEPAIFVDATFDIDTGQERVAVDPAEARWATLVTRTVQVTETSGEANKHVKSRKEEWIPVGAGVIAAGRVRRSNGAGAGAARMTSTGPESLLLFAAPPGTEARGELEAQLQARRGLLFVLVVIAVVAAASALAVVAQLL